MPGVQSVREMLDGVNAYYEYDRNNQPVYDDYGMRQHAKYNLAYDNGALVRDENNKFIEMEYEGSFIITKKVAVPTEDGKILYLEEESI